MTGILDGIEEIKAMFPDSIPHFSIGPLCGLIANATLAILCLVIWIIYRHYAR